MTEDETIVYTKYRRAIAMQLVMPRPLVMISSGETPDRTIGMGKNCAEAYAAAAKLIQEEAAAAAQPAQTENPL